MPKIETINDRDSYILPTVSDMRSSQKEGMADEGLNTTDCTELNAVQGHQADMKDFDDGPTRAKLFRKGMMTGTGVDVNRLDGDDKGGWPEIVEL